LKRSERRRLRVVPRKHTSGRPGSPSAATTSGCHRMAGRGCDEGGEIRRIRERVARVASRKHGPRAPNRREWCAARRRAVGLHQPAANQPPDAPCGAPRPSSFEGWSDRHTSGRFRPREHMRSSIARCLTIEFGCRRWGHGLALLRSRRPRDGGRWGGTRGRRRM